MPREERKVGRKKVKLYVSWTLAVITGILIVCSALYFAVFRIGNVMASEESVKLLAENKGHDKCLYHTPIFGSEVWVAGSRDGSCNIEFQFNLYIDEVHSIETEKREGPLDRATIETAVLTPGFELFRFEVEIYYWDPLKPFLKPLLEGKLLRYQRTLSFQ
jgi:hypothetical protein